MEQNGRLENMKITTFIFGTTLMYRFNNDSTINVISKYAMMMKRRVTFRQTYPSNVRSKFHNSPVNFIRSTTRSTVLRYYKIRSNYHPGNSPELPVQSLTVTDEV
jgi:hypothetical protein